MESFGMSHFHIEHFFQGNKRKVAAPASHFDSKLTQTENLDIKKYCAPLLTHTYGLYHYIIRFALRLYLEL